LAANSGGQQLKLRNFARIFRELNEDDDNEKEKLLNTIQEYTAIGQNTKGINQNTLRSSIRKLPSLRRHSNIQEDLVQQI
jgi:hypothetical protein